MHDHRGKSNLRVLESLVHLSSSILGSREGDIRWLSEEEVDVVKDRVPIASGPLMGDDDGARCRIKGHIVCGRLVSVEFRAEDAGVIVI